MNHLRRYMQDPSLIFRSDEEIKIAGALLLNTLTSSSRAQQGWQLIHKIGQNMNQIFTPQAAYRLMNGIATVRGPKDIQLSLEHMQLLTALDHWAREKWGNTLYFYRTILQSLNHAPAPNDGAGEYCGGYTAGLQTIHGLGTDRPFRSIVELYTRVPIHTEARQLVLSIMSLLHEQGIILTPHGGGATTTSEFHVLHWNCPLQATGIYYEPEVQHGTFTLPALGIDPEDPELLELSSLVESKLEAIEALYERLWTDIHEPNYDVYLQGRDAFEVEGILGRINGRYRYFLREGLKFPEINTVARRRWSYGDRYIVRKMGTDLFAYASEQGQRTMEYAHLDPSIRRIHMMRIADILVNLATYHSIVCAPKAKQRNTDRVYAPKIERLEGAKVHQFVRPYFRSLCPGWQPSDKKREEAVARLGWLPKGHTFVADFERNVALSGGSATAGNVPASKRVDIKKLINDI